MADTDTITYRASFTSLALSTLGGSPEWDRRLAELLKWDALQHAECEVGAYAKASEEASMEVYRLQSEYGPHFRNHTRRLAELVRLEEAKAQAENHWSRYYCDHYWQAARDLAQTPAPNLAAAAFKEQLMFAQDLGNDTLFDDDCMAILTADFERLMQGEAA